MLKILIVFLVSVMAFSSTMSIISSYVSMADYYKLFVSVIILFAVNTSTNLAVISILDRRKKKTDNSILAENDNLSDSTK